MRKRRKLCAMLIRAAANLLPTSLPGTPLDVRLDSGVAAGILG
jgi:hypothetical protein